jgi:calcium/calmodulin-dependent protein kinase I/calcium-dependent protein kinase
MAIKAFSKNIAYSEENGKEGLINEIKIMRLFNHPNIIKLYEVHETSNSLYICLELLEGG